MEKNHVSLFENVPFSNLLLRHLVGQTSEGHVEGIHSSRKKKSVSFLIYQFSFFFFLFLLVNQNIMILQLL